MDLVNERLALTSFLKNNSTKVEAILKSIKVGDFSLVPVGKYLLDDLDLLDSLASWRNTNVNAYPSRFTATRESTKNWLNNVVINGPDKLLFLVLNPQGKTVGHMGLAAVDNNSHIIEIDNVARWDQDVPKGLFSQALTALIEWARKSMYVDNFILKVFSTNSRAISFYKKNKFTENREIKMILSEKSTDQFQVLVESSSQDIDSYDELMIEMIYRSDVEIIPDSLILTAGPSISQYESCYAYDAAQNGWNSNWSKYLVELQEKFKEFIGVKYALATSSCTGAMHIALAALDIGPGDEVIVPDQTWVATANAVRYVGATPVFVDINIDNWTIDPHQIEIAITPKTKAIMPVHMYGHPASMEEILAIAKKNNLFVVEDAAPSIGAEFNGRKTGSFGHFSAFSFQGAKLMVTGEGGMLLTDDDDLYAKAKKIWDQGRNSEINIPFWIDEKGLKYKMSNVQAAIGLGQLNRINTLVAMKRRIFDWYSKYLSSNNYVVLNRESESCKSIYWMTSIRILENSKINRNQLMARLREDNVDTRPVFPAISQYPIWDNNDLKPQPIAFHVGNNCINLPSGVCLLESEVKYVCSRINYHTGS